MDKRNFIKTLGALSFSPMISASEFSKNHSLSKNLPKIDNDDELWKTVRSHYTLKDDYINLESGYYNIIPEPILDHFIKHVKHVNECKVIALYGSEYRSVCPSISSMNLVR